MRISDSAGGTQGLLGCRMKGVESFACPPISDVSQKVLYTELGVACASWGGVTGGPLQIPCYLLASVMHQE